MRRHIQRGTQHGLDSDLAEDWRDLARCRDMDGELFFPVGESAWSKLDHAMLQAQVAAAKSVCRKCPVSEQCLDLALADGIRYGIWGGLTPSERKEVAAR